MPEFNPSPSDELKLGGERYRVMPHPSVPDFAFGQEGRKAFVFQLEQNASGALYALKKFKPAFQHKEMVDICAGLERYAHLPGMSVCQRVCLTSKEYKAVLSEYPDLEYAVLMPWANGSTWYDLVVGQTALDRDSSLQMAWKTAAVLAGLEREGAAHCDIAAANIIVDMQHGEIHLVDVEDMYADGVPKPQSIPAGTEGYNHVTSHAGLWSPYADRFAGAVLLAEMLGWHDQRVRDHSDEEHYFAADQMQQDSEAYQVLAATLRDLDPRLAVLFEQAWFSETLEECPSLSAWEPILERKAQVDKMVSEWVPIGNGPPPAAPNPSNWQTQRGTNAQTAPVIEPPANPAPPPTPIQPPAAPTDPGSPLVGFRPLNAPASAGSGGNNMPAQPASSPVSDFRPIEMPAQPAPVEDKPVAAPQPIEAPTAPPPGDEGPSLVEVMETLSDEQIVPPAQAEVEKAADEIVDTGALSQEETESAAANATKPLVSDDFVVEDDPSIAPGMLAHAPQLSASWVRANGNFVLRWKPIEVSDYYLLQESPDDAFSGGKQATIDNATEWHVTGRPEGRYYYRVRAHAGQEHSAWSNVVPVEVGKGFVDNVSATIQNVWSSFRNG